MQSMPEFILRNVPKNVSTAGLLEKIDLLSNLAIFSELPVVTLTYLGGITNHGLKIEELDLFLRIPGSNAEIFIDRTREKSILTKLSNKGFYSKEIQLFLDGELLGYKIEPFLAGETLQFIDFYHHQFKVLPTLKALHDSGVKFSHEYDIFEKLQSMLMLLISHQQQSIPLLKSKDLMAYPIVQLCDIIASLQKIKQQKFTSSQLLPCHNDITPTNFIHLNSPIHGRDYQLIDWEYGGMNDPMYDLAGITAMLALPLQEVSPMVCHYFGVKNEEQIINHIQRVQFYMPIVKLYYAIWAALQVVTGNESSSYEELKQGWGPDSLTVFLEQYQSDFYQDLIK